MKSRTFARSSISLRDPLGRKVCACHVDRAVRERDTVEKLRGESWIERMKRERKRERL